MPRTTARVQTQQLRKVTQSKTKGGRLERVSLTEILKHLEAHNATGELKITSKAIDTNGLMCVVRGRAVHAKLGALADAEAIARMLVLDRGRFEFHPKKKIKLKTMNAALRDLV